MGKSWKRIKRLRERNAPAAEPVETTAAPEPVKAKEKSTPKKEEKKSKRKKWLT